MFTHLFQFWLTAMTVGLIVLAVNTYITDRSARRVAKLQAAIDLAQAQMMFRIQNGDYINQPIEKFNQDYRDMLVNAYHL